MGNYTHIGYSKAKSIRFKNKSHLLFILENEACLLENANFFKVWLYQLDLLISSENF